MSRPIWKGNISFGLVNIPVTLFSAENPAELQFHLLDKKNKARIHYQRINEVSGKKVDWEDIVKAYEFEKGKYVVVDEKELEKAEAPNFKTVEIKQFVDIQSIEPIYFDKPYYLVPNKQGEKGYNLLLETMERSGKAAIAEVVLKTKQHIAAVFPYHHILLLNLLRYIDEIRKPEEFYQPEQTKSYKVTLPEIEMAERLVKSMTKKWEPKKHHNRSREILSDWIENKIHRGKGIAAPAHDKKRTKAPVIDFMDLLKKSIRDKEKKASGKKSKK